MVNYVCPLSLKIKPFPFIVCKASLKGRTKEAALKAYCPHQKQCQCVHEMVNTDAARPCYADKIKNI